jgi:outer membrane protein TolC
LSTATIIDVLSLEDRLTAASLNYISAQNDYSIAVVSLRFLTGTIFTETNDVQSLSLESLTTIPGFE